MTYTDNDLAVQIELEKLTQHLHLQPATRQALALSGAGNIRQLREEIERRRYDLHREGFQRLARWLRWLSVKRLAHLAASISPRMAARLVSEMDPYIAAKVARRLSPAFLSDIASNAEPDKIREIIGRLPAELVRDVALEQVAGEDYILLGRFADALSAPAIREVVNAISDDAVLLNIAFYMENTKQLSNIIRMIDNDRIASVVRAGTVNAALWPKAIWVIDNVEGELKSRLGNIMAAEDEQTLNALVGVAHEQGLWGPVLRALSAVNPKHYHKIVNLPALRDEAVITGLVNSAVSLCLLQEALPLVKAMQRQYQEVVAHTVLRQGEEVAEAVLEAAHAARQWDLILDLAQFLDDSERDMLARLPISHDRAVIETLMQAAAQAGKMDLLLDFARRFHREGLHTVVEISLRDSGDLLQSFLDAARHTRNGWDAIAQAVSVVEAPDMLRDIGKVYQRQSPEDRDAFQQAAERLGAWSQLEGALGAA